MKRAARHLFPVVLLIAASCGSPTDDSPTADAGPPPTADAGPPPTADAGPPPSPDAGSDDCPTWAFLDLTGASGAGDGYPAPRLRVSCTADKIIVESNGIPHYRFVQMTPNALAAQNYRWEIPRYPALAVAPTDIPRLGLAAFSITGIPVYGPNEGPMPATSAFGDPVYNGITDECFGHTAMRGDYHDHALSERCLNRDSLVAEPWMNPEPTGTAQSPILGFSWDGFPILGPHECVDAACSSVVERLSSYEVTGDPMRNAWDAYTYRDHGDPLYLDRCNGHVGPDGDYHYHATSGFPYVIGCYAGTPGPGNGGGMMMP
ncbi:MAG: YHYH protein [Myxococcales bacterium]|nr:YHYH protein [Myxococcales bacterium]